MAGLTLDIGANTREVVRGMKDVTDVLEDVGDSLDDLARGGDKAGDKLEDSFKGTIQQTEKVERSFKDMASTVQRETKDAGDSTRRNLKDGTDGASKGIEEMGDEAASTGKEMAASFSSVEDGLDAIQELAANALAGFGPAGLVAGAAVAIGLGLAITAGQEAADAINEAKERTGELAQELYDVGGDIDQIDLGAKMREWGVEVADSKEFWELWQRSAVSNLDKASAAADDFGVDIKTMFRAMSGYDMDATLAVLDDLKGQLQEVQEQARKNRDENIFAGFSDNAALSARETALKNQIAALQNMTGVTDDAIAANKLLTEITEEDTAAQARATEAADRRAQAVESINEAYDEAAEGVQDYIDDESGLFDVGAYINAMQAREDAIRNYQQTLASTPLSADAKAFLQAQGVESAATFLAGYQSAAPDQQRALDRIWSEAARSNSGTYTKGLEQGIPDTMAGPVVSPSVDLRTANSQMAAFVAQRRVANIEARVNNYASNGVRGGMGIP